MLLPNHPRSVASMYEDPLAKSTQVLRSLRSRSRSRRKPEHERIYMPRPEATSKARSSLHTFAHELQVATMNLCHLLAERDRAIKAARSAGLSTAEIDDLLTPIGWGEPLWRVVSAHRVA